MKVAAIIPARYASQRFPGKTIAPLAGKPMIQRVWERVRLARGIGEVVVATDDERVAEVVNRCGGHVLMTSKKHQSGTERCAEACELLNAELVINVQGDEPLIHPESLELIIRPLFDDERLAMATLKHPIEKYEDYQSPHVVKVVCDGQDNALYFSRSPIPFYRDRQRLLEQWEREGTPPTGLKPPPMKHIGIYAYRAEFLMALARMPRAEIETAESLEQLRALAWGFKINAPTTPHDSIGVDTAEDLAKVEKIIRERGEGVS